MIALRQDCDGSASRLWRGRWTAGIKCGQIVAAGVDVGDRHVVVDQPIMIEGAFRLTGVSMKTSGAPAGRVALKCAKVSPKASTTALLTAVGEGEFMLEDSPAVFKGTPRPATKPQSNIPGTDPN